MHTLPEFDLGEMLRRLVSGKVEFVVIGGIAAVAHASPRLTQDLDIVYSTDEANLDALGRVLVEMGARLRGVGDDVPFVPDARTLQGAQILTLDTELGQLDVHVRPSGAPPFATLRRHAEHMEIGGMDVLVASIADLIEMKRAAGRPKDLADIAELETIQRLRVE